jgi:hypothetical protein
MPMSEYFVVAFSEKLGNIATASAPGKRKLLFFEFRVSGVSHISIVSSCEIMCVKREVREGE